MAERMALSAMRKYNLQNTKYSYKSAIMLEGMYKAATVLNNREMFDYVKNFLEKYVHEDGKVEVFKLEELFFHRIVFLFVGIHRVKSTTFFVLTAVLAIAILRTHQTA